MERLKLKVAVYLLLIKDEKIFLLRRFNTGWQDGNYTLASGHLEEGETIMEALLRESREEIGLTLRPEGVRLVLTMHRMSTYIDFFFAVDAWEGDPGNMELDKCDEAAWFPLDALPENMVPSVRFAIEKYREGIAFSEFDSES